jgi:hypothetical protein
MGKVSDFIKQQVGWFGDLDRAQRAISRLLGQEAA